MEFRVERHGACQKKKVLLQRPGYCSKPAIYVTKGAYGIRAAGQVNAAEFSYAHLAYTHQHSPAPTSNTYIPTTTLEHTWHHSLEKGSAID